MKLVLKEKRKHERREKKHRTCWTFSFFVFGYILFNHQLCCACFFSCLFNLALCPTTTTVATTSTQQQIINCHKR
jgi:hypothetical protein